MLKKEDMPMGVHRYLVSLSRKLSAFDLRVTNGVIQYDDTEGCYKYYDKKTNSLNVRCSETDQTYIELINDVLTKIRIGAYKNYPAIPDVQFYHQMDPRGVSVYLYRERDVKGRNISSCYSSFALPIY